MIQPLSNVRQCHFSMQDIAIPIHSAVDQVFDSIRDLTQESKMQERPTVEWKFLGISVCLEAWKKLRGVGCLLHYCVKMIPLMFNGGVFCGPTNFVAIEVLAASED